MSIAELTSAEARRVALGAQGLATTPKRASFATWPRIERAIRQIQLLQIDSVNVLSRSHYLPVFSRVGSYRRGALDKRSNDHSQRKLFEYWGHEASFLPLELHPLLRWRMKDAANGDGMYKQLRNFAEQKRDYVKQVLDCVRAEGPSVVSTVPGAQTGTADDNGWWSWRPGKMALEYLFWTGEVTAAARRNNFERTYDLPERVIPSAILNAPTPSKSEAVRELVLRSSEALGVGTETDLRDYFRLPVAATKQALSELVENGDLIEVSVEGWKQIAYLRTDAAMPRRATGTALLSPFDPLVWERKRAERIFGFRYRIEIYTPASKRKYGYYVLPFLHSGRLVARVCLKSDREASTLRVNAAHIESEHDATTTAEALSHNLVALGNWLGLDSVHVARKGNLSAALRSVTSHSRELL